MAEAKSKTAAHCASVYGDKVRRCLQRTAFNGVVLLCVVVSSRWGVSRPSYSIIYATRPPPPRFCVCNVSIASAYVMIVAPFKVWYPKQLSVHFLLLSSVFFFSSSFASMLLACSPLRNERKPCNAKGTDRYSRDCWRR